MSRILSIDTATEACSAALWVDGEVTEEFIVAPRQHARLILPMVDRLLADAGLALGGLDCLAFGRGPGAFTGVRLAAGVAQGLALGTGLPVVGVSDLAALAQGVIGADLSPRVIACLDARMGEIYAGFFVGREGLAVLQGRETVVAPDDLPVPSDGPWFAAGPGWAAYPALAARFDGVLGTVDSTRLPHARDIALLAERGLRAGEARSADEALPVYLRDRVARPPTT